MWGFRDSLAVPPSALILCSGSPDEALELQQFVWAQLCLEIISQSCQSTPGQDPAGASAGSTRRFPLLSVKQLQWNNHSIYSLSREIPGPAG